MPSTIKEWVFDLPPKHQSVLMTATRGPDVFRYPAVKELNRWIRDKLFIDADPSNPFILKPGDRSMLDTEFLKDVTTELEYTQMHYFSHVLHALEIIAYMHPNHQVQTMAFNVYDYLVYELHLGVETYEAFRSRLG
jgi:hypothetical protein